MGLRGEGLGTHEESHGKCNGQLDWDVWFEIYRFQAVLGFSELCRALQSSAGFAGCLVYCRGLDHSQRICGEPAGEEIGE